MYRFSYRLIYNLFFSESNIHFTITEKRVNSDGSLELWIFVDYIFGRDEKMVPSVKNPT